MEQRSLLNILVGPGLTELFEKSSPQEIVDVLYFSQYCAPYTVAQGYVDLSAAGQTERANALLARARLEWTEYAFQWKVLGMLIPVFAERLCEEESVARTIHSMVTGMFREALTEHSRMLIEAIGRGEEEEE